MPIIWRYLLGQYLKVFCLAVTTFIAVLFVSRLQQIAQFASLGAGAGAIGLFALYLIPYILPIAVPISCLLSAIVLFQRLSHTHELTAMRACGMGLRRITTPILLAGAFLAVGNFFVASELATHSHLLGKKMQANQGQVNPLLLLQKSNLLRFNDIFVDMRTIKSGEIAKDVTLVIHNPMVDRLVLLNADQLEMAGDQLYGTEIDLISAIPADGAADHLGIEQVEQMWTPTQTFSHLVKGIAWRPKNSHLRLRLLSIRLRQSSDPTEVARGVAEIFRRISLAIAALTFTLMGCAFGIDIGRRASYRGLAYGIGLATFFVICFVAAGSLDTHLVIAPLLYLTPHLIISLLCLRALRRAAGGVE